MAPPKRSQGSGQKKGGQALISRFFSSQSAQSTTKPKLTPPKSTTTPVKPSPSAPIASTPTGITPVARRASDGVGKRVLPSKRWRATTPPKATPTKFTDSVEDDDVMNLDGDESDGGEDAGDDDFCPEPGASGAVDLAGVDADSEDSDAAEEITRPKRRRKLVIDSDDDDDAAAFVEGDADADSALADSTSNCDEEAVERQGSSSESKIDHSARTLLGVYDASVKASAPRNHRMQKKFERAVGRLDSNSWFMRTTGGSGGGGDAGGGTKEGEVNGNGQYMLGNLSSHKAGKVKYTPLEQQFVDIKKKHPDKLLLVECGYKFQFFGEDALVASKVCRIYCAVKQNFNVASVPTVTLARHVSRLVAAGHKIGIVRQIDTAALKKASGKSGAFRRELCEVYTRGTLFADGALGETTGSGSFASYIAAFQEFSRGDVVPSDDRSVKISVVAVDTATGDVVFDSFVDDVMRSELDARLMALEPVEVVASKAEMTTVTERSLAHYCHVSNARLDRVSDKSFNKSSGGQEAGNGLVDIRSLIENACSSSGNKIVLDDVLGCATALTLYLRQFKLERAIRGAHQFRSFAARKEMRLGADVIRNFELFHNSNDGRRNGSLLSLIDRTRTPFGARQMKHWLAHPLTDAIAIRNRLGAVESLRQLVDGAFVAQGGVRGSLTADAWLVELLETLSKSFPDLERGLARISYEKCTPSLFLGIVNAFGSVADVVQSMKQGMEAASTGDGGTSICLKSPLLAKMIEGVPDVAPTLDRFVFSRLQMDAMNSNDFRRIFKEKEALAADAGIQVSSAELELDQRVEDLAQRREKIARCEEDLDSLLMDLRREFKRPSWEWKKVAQDEYLLEVPTKNAKSMPKDWEIVNTTKAQKRYRPRRAAALLQLLEQARELCDEAAAASWKAFLGLFSTTTVDLRAVVRFLCDLDCLASHARTSLLPDYAKPEILDPAATKAGVHAEEARHPIAEALLNAPYVPNDVSLGASPEDGSATSERCMVITGPNMGGKSSYIRMTGLLSIMAQIGSYVPAKSARVSPFDAMFCRMGARDMIGKGMSTLMCELAETSKILEAATNRSMIVLDELGRGTSTHDGTAIAAATLEHLVSSSSAVVLFVTHFPSIARLADSYEVDVGSYYLDYLEEHSGSSAKSEAEPNCEQKKRITFLYKVTSGVAKRSYGLNVAQLAGLPGSVIDRAAIAASLFDKSTLARSEESTIYGVVSSLASSVVDKAGTLAAVLGSADE